MPPKRVDSLVPKAIPLLIKVARNRARITYKGLAESIGTHARVTPIILDRIRTLCIDNCWPPLTAIVINKTTNKPGDSFYDPWLPADSTENARMSMWDRMLNEVYSFDWEPVLNKYPELKEAEFVFNDNWFSKLSELTHSIIFHYVKESGTDEMQFNRLHRSVINSIEELKQWVRFKEKYPYIKEIPRSVAKSRNGVWAEYCVEDLKSLIEESNEEMQESLKSIADLMKAFSIIQFLLENAFDFIWNQGLMWGNIKFVKESDRQLYNELFGVRCR